MAPARHFTAVVRFALFILTVRSIQLENKRCFFIACSLSPMHAQTKLIGIDNRQGLEDERKAQSSLRTSYFTLTVLYHSFE